MRKIALLAIVVAAMAIPLGVYASHQFTDVPDSNVFHNSIDWMSDNAITVGCNAAGTQYCPNDNVTRGQMSAFMKRLAEKEIVNAATAVNATTADVANAVANGAVGTAQIAPDAAGVAVAGVLFFDNATVVNSFNRFGGAPTVTNTGTGEYEIAFPGLEGLLGANAIVIATDADGPINLVRHFLGGSNDVITLRTYDVDGVLQNADVNVVVMSTNASAAAVTSSLDRESE